MTMQLYVVSGSPYSWRVQLALEGKGLPYELRVLSLASGALRTPEYLRLNPRGRVPTLVDGEVVVYESLAILAYLERRYAEPALLGHTPLETAAVWRVISEYTAYLDAAVESFILPMYFGHRPEQKGAIQGAIEIIDAELAGSQTTLTNQPYLAGHAVTAADFVVFPHVRSVLRAASKQGARAYDLPFLPLAKHLPALQAWLERIEALPFYLRTYPPHWQAPGEQTGTPERVKSSGSQ